MQRLADSFGSPNILTTTHICTWNRYFGAKNTFGVLTPTPDVENTNCILLWGTNPQACEPALAVNISHARRRGAKLIVIDPRQHALAAKADCWLRVRPGSDGALALAMIHVLLEEGLHDEAFVRDWTNGPFLVRDDTEALLTATDLSAAGAANAFVVWDRGCDGPVVWHPETGYARANVAPALHGRFECKLANGSAVTCQPVLDRLKQLAARFARSNQAPSPGSTPTTFAAPFACSPAKSRPLMRPGPASNSTRAPCRSIGPSPVSTR